MGTKRKSKTKTEEGGSEEIPKKQTKTMPAASDQEDNDAADGDEQVLREPSKQEIEESFKPENTINVQTVRDKKKKVTKKIKEQKKIRDVNESIEAAKAYLQQWKNDRESWKFHKLKQVFIQTNCFDPSKISDDVWDICLEYLDGAKGRSREVLVADAEKLIAELDSKGDLDDQTKIQYNRARDLLQMLS